MTSILALILLVQIVSLVDAAVICDLNPVLLNQDPYPAVPGETVKIVFQVDGLANSQCGDVAITLNEDFPFEVEPGTNPTVNLASGTYVKDFESFALVPYWLVINKDALDGENNIDLDITTTAGGKTTHSFDIEVSDLRTDYEISIKNYDPSTKIMTFEILNTGEHDVEALTIDVPKQDNFAIKGTSRNIIGSLDSNDDTTFSFEGVPSNGDIKLIVTYTDEINERRMIEKTVSFDEDYFDGRGVKEGRSVWFYITIIILLIIGYRWWKARRDKKRRREGRH